MNNTQGLLVNTNTCVDETDGKTITCDKNYESTVGLLSVYEYNLAGASDSYLNIGSYWWTSNKDSDGNAWYVYKKGTVNNDSSSGYTYYSYGVRPTITINGKISDNTLSKIDYLIVNEIELEQMVGSDNERSNFLLDNLKDSARLSGQDEDEEHTTISAYLDYLEEMRG